MKTYKERTDSILHKAQAQKKLQSKKNIYIATSCILLFVIVASLVLFLPIYSDPNDISRYADSPYYDVINRLSKNHVFYHEYSNNWERLMNEFGAVKKDYESDSPDVEFDDGMAGDTPGNTPGNTEVTDNQVQGVTEADLFKRTQSHVFYLQSKYDYTISKLKLVLDLKVYSIDKENSKEVASLSIGTSEGYTFYNIDNCEMFLSSDSTKLIIFNSVKSSDYQDYTAVIFVDITNPLAPVEINRTYIAGNYVTSRNIDGKILAFTDWDIQYFNNFDDPSKYIPSIGNDTSMSTIDAKDIVLPEDETPVNSYTIALLFDENGNKLSQKAMLCSQDAVYVSADDFWIASSQRKLFNDEENGSATAVVSNIYRYTFDSSIDLQGTVMVEGSVLNQYSMDKKDGIFRVVTTIETSYYNYDNYVELTTASLFCIDVQTMQTVASYERFAPQGEKVMSARFVGDKAYVCTAVVYNQIVLDPVFEIDLSDLSNITATDTGTITGYSLSLRDYTDGTLLGIGYGDSLDQLKIELYRPSEDSIISIDKIEMNDTDFSESYKAYMIDVDDNLIGLCVINGNEYRYLLLTYKDNALTVVNSIKLPYNISVDSTRATYIDGYLYIFTIQGMKAVAVQQ